MSTTGTTPAVAEQGLEKASARTPAVITTPEEYRGALLRWQASGFNILTPFTNISGLAVSHGMISSLVQVDVNPTAGDVYDGLPFLKAGEVALAKLGLRKLAECAGISIHTERTDPRTIPHYWEIRAVASYRGVDGALVTREATEEWDLRDGSDRLKGWTPNQITEGRKHGLRNCEARAINAAIRESGCGVKQKYLKTELAKPFVVCRVVFQPDMRDPDTKRIVTENYFRSTAALYPAQAQVVDAEVVEAAPGRDQPRHAGSGSTSSAPPSAPAPNADEPPTPDAVRIVRIDSKSGETRGKKWTRFSIVDSRGQEYSTFEKQHYDDALRFKEANAWVEISVEVDGPYTNLLEITKAGEQPTLLPSPNDL